LDLHLQTMNTFLDIQPKLDAKIITGRQITLQSIRKLIQHLGAKQIGLSVEKRPIHEIDMGSGPIKILMWSQMHGNESTSTKGLLDVLCYLKLNPAILASFTLKIIPMLNPDGAVAYTRVNANQVDLNRDAVQQTQPESQLLVETYNSFKPDYCFNLHDQRTIFGVNGHPCMLSFLAPAANASKAITPARVRAMGIIGFINEALQYHIPNQVGRYDDSFNQNCMGDYFTSQGTPTLLFECGQVGEDYARENTRKWFGFSLLKALESIAENRFSPDEYTTIPEVEKSFVDVLIKNVKQKGNSLDIELQFVETLDNEKVDFIPIIHSIGELQRLKGHKTVDLIGKDIELQQDIIAGDNAIWLAQMLNLTQYSH
jgi:hypothetical protein